MLTRATLVRRDGIWKAPRAADDITSVIVTCPWADATMAAGTNHPDVDAEPASQPASKQASSRCTRS